MLPASKNYPVVALKHHPFVLHTLTFVLVYKPSQWGRLWRVSVNIMVQCFWNSVNGLGPLSQSISWYEIDES